jgi:hypothetical protein
VEKMLKTYTIKNLKKEPALQSDWNSKEWIDAEIADISIFRDESSSHHPKTVVKLLYTQNGIYGKFKVEDKYVRSVESGYQAPVCQDSCVEFFVKPKRNRGYLNFEFNCGGTLLCSYITDATRTETGFKEMVELKECELNQVKIYHSLPSIVEPEIREETEWFIGFYIPFSLLEKYVGKLHFSKESEHSEWRGNFYKCGDKTSHPHWASWNPITTTNFHLPECFGVLKFEKPY